MTCFSGKSNVKRLENAQLSFWLSLFISSSFSVPQYLSVYLFSISQSLLNLSLSCPLFPFVRLSPFFIHSASLFSLTLSLSPYHIRSRFSFFFILFVSLSLSHSHSVCVTRIPVTQWSFKSVIPLTKYLPIYLSNTFLSQSLSLSLSHIPATSSQL